MVAFLELFEEDPDRVVKLVTKQLARAFRPVKGSVTIYFAQGKISGTERKEVE